MMQRMRAAVLTRVSFWTFCALGCLSGLGLAHFMQINVPTFLPWVLVAATIIARKYRGAALIIIITASFLWGMQRGVMYVQQQSAYEQLFGQKLTATVIASSDAVYDSRYQLVFPAHNFQPVGATKPLAGTVQVGGFGMQAVFAGDQLEVTGKLRAPYGSGQGSMSFAQLSLIAHHQTTLSVFRRKFITAIQSSLPEPLAAFGSGLLIGQRSTLPKPIKDTLLAVGLTHIIAVSGYNLTILVHALRRSWLRYSKRLNYMLASSLMIGFVLLTGASASITRAAIVSGLSITVGYYGRTIQPVLLLLLAAALTGWINPFYVWGDASWYLSFLAFTGILLFAPLFGVCWHIKNVFLMVLIETISAELMTIPYVLATFGQISLISLPANVLVVSMVPLAMLCTAVSAIAGLLALPIAGWASWPAELCLTYMLDIAQVLSRVPHSFQKNIGFSLWQMFFVYGVVFGVYLVLRYQAVARRDKITEITEKLQRSSARERSQQMVND